MESEGLGMGVSEHKVLAWASKGVSDNYGAVSEGHREVMGQWDYVIRPCLCLLAEIPEGFSRIPMVSLETYV